MPRAQTIKCLRGQRLHGSGCCHTFMYELLLANIQFLYSFEFIKPAATHTHKNTVKKSEVHCSIIHLNTLKIQCHACANFSAYKSCLCAFIARTHMHTQTQSVWSNRLFWSVDNAYIEYIYSRGKYQNKLFTKISKYLLDFLQWNLFADCSQNQDVANISTLNHVTNIVKSTFCNIWNIRKITSL